MDVIPVEGYPELLGQCVLAFLLLWAVVGCWAYATHALFWENYRWQRAERQAGRLAKTRGYVVREQCVYGGCVLVGRRTCGPCEVVANIKLKRAA